MIDPRTTALTPICITYCSYLSFCLLLLICSFLSIYMLSNFCFVPRQLYSLCLILLCALNLTLVAQSCCSVRFKSISQFGDNTFIDLVSSSKFAVFYCFNDLCFVKWVSEYNCKLFEYLTNRSP